MKYLLMSLFLLTCLVSCSDDDIVCDETAGRYGEANMLLNGRPWTFAAIAGTSGCNDRNLTLGCAYYEGDLARMALTFGNFPNRTGTYQLQRKDPPESECALNLIYASFNLLEGDLVAPGLRVPDYASRTTRPGLRVPDYAS